ncbi:MAG TPA: GrpB family protein [Pyrinomonadaceae bacterium]|nr:GrpB family protein [Pyrinomonadaceae bacterium]
MYGMRKDELRLVPHDPAWGDDFLAEQGRIADALGDPTARIEHVGSTAIPTVHAKPILDIAILCGEKGLEPVAQTLRLLGYDYRGQFDEEVGHYYAILDRGNVRLCQAHIFTEATADWYSKLRFRDVLRRDVGLAREYDDYKLELAKVAANKGEYAEIKSRWVDTFIRKVMSAPLDA